VANLADLRNLALELKTLALAFCQCKSRAKGGKGKRKYVLRKKKEYELLTLEEVFALDDPSVYEFIPLEEAKEEIDQLSETEIQLGSIERGGEPVVVTLYTPDYVSQSVISTNLQQLMRLLQDEAEALDREEAKIYEEMYAIALLLG